MKILQAILILTSIAFTFCGYQAMINSSELRRDLELKSSKQQAHSLNPSVVHNDSDELELYSNWNMPYQSTKGENWTFDLFTSPTITKIDDQFDATLPWLQQLNSKTFPLHIKSFAKKKYPLQFSGYLLEPNSNVSEYLIILYDYLENRSLIVRNGDFLTKYNVKIKNFIYNADANNDIDCVHPEVLLEDLTESIYVTLLPNVVYYDDIFDIIIENTTDMNQIAIERVGDFFESNNLACTVTKIDNKFKRLTLECVDKLYNRKFSVEMKYSR